MDNMDTQNQPSSQVPDQAQSQAPKSAPPRRRFRMSSGMTFWFDTAVAVLLFRKSDTEVPAGRVAYWMPGFVTIFVLAMSSMATIGPYWSVLVGLIEVVVAYWMSTRFAANEKSGRANFYVMTTMFSTIGVLGMDGSASLFALLVMTWIVVAYLAYTMRSSRIR